MTIGIIGTGKVGTSLGTGFADSRLSVVLGSRDPSQTRLLDWAFEDPEYRRVTDRRGAVESADTVILAVPGRALPETLDAVGRGAFAGKLVIDATNPFATNARGDSVDAFGDNDSGTEYLQRELPGASVVKAFNEGNPSTMLRPEKASTRVMRIAGNDADAKRRVTELLEGFGWRVEDLGDVHQARELEHAVIGRYVHA